MQRQIYRDHFVTLTKIAHFGRLGAKIAFCGLASLALRFQWFQESCMNARKLGVSELLLSMLVR